MGGSNGTLHILNGSYFSVDQSHHPILLKGQLTADFNSPSTVYAIKFDRFLMDLFKTKLAQFIAGTLSANEYFIVQNIHTKFSIENLPNIFNVKVDDGQVKFTANKTERIINSGKQISVDASNNVKESIYLGFRIYAIIIGVLILISGTILFMSKNTKAGRKIINGLKITGKRSFKTVQVITAEKHGRFRKK
jgi:hypothetical protein